MGRTPSPSPTRDLKKARTDPGKLVTQIFTWILEFQICIERFQYSIQYDVNVWSLSTLKQDVASGEMLDALSATHAARALLHEAATKVCEESDEKGRQKVAALPYRIPTNLSFAKGLNMNGMCVSHLADTSCKNFDNK